MKTKRYQTTMNRDANILVTGGTGLAGSAIVRALAREGYERIVATCHGKKPERCHRPELLRNRAVRFVRIDLLEQRAVGDFLRNEKPQYVFAAAAKVGGIMANHTHRAQFIYENLQMQNNLIHQSFLQGVKKLIFLGSTCIYPKDAPQPMKEEHLCTGKLEYTSEPYGIAKIAGVKMCESYNLQYGTNFLAVMPTNLYGPNDNYDLDNSHFLPAFIRKMHLAKCLMRGDWESIGSDLDKNPIGAMDGSASREKIVETLGRYGIKLDAATRHASISLWGTGTPRREVMHADDLADACIHIARHVDFKDIAAPRKVSYSTGVVQDEIRDLQINIGLGRDFSIGELAEMVRKTVAFKGEIIWDDRMPDGTYQKLTDTARLQSLGWRSKVEPRDGIQRVYKEYCEKW